MNYCSECGAEVEGDESYCPECGAELNSTQSENIQKEPGRKDTQEDDEFITNGQAIGITILLLVGITVVGIAQVPTDSVETEQSPSGNTENQGSNTQDPSTSGDGGSTGSSQSSSTDTVTHEIGETFTVGSGDRSVEYTVEEATTADSIGTSFASSEADGTFVIVRLTIENSGTEPFMVTNDHLSLIDEEGRTFSAATGAGVYVTQDDRYEAESLSFEELQPGLSITRNVIYDVSSGQGYGLQVEGASMFSTADPHYVPLGQVE
jgi:hypothetical protein